MCVCVCYLLLLLWRHEFSEGFPDGSVVKNAPVNAGDASLIPGSGRSPRAGNGNLLQYSCLKNFMDRGAWRATVRGSQRVRHDLVTKTDNSKVQCRLDYLHETQRCPSSVCLPDTYFTDEETEAPGGDITGLATSVEPRSA